MKLTDLTKELFDYLIAFRRKVSQTAAPNIDIVRHEIELVFRSIEEKVVGNSKRLAEEYRQVKYPLVVLADEVFLTSRWTHAKKWEQYLLEKKFYSSNIGGNQFFRLLANVDRMPSSVITIYFYCLALGFRGGFQPDDPSLLRLKGRLLNRIMPAESNDDEVILPDAYRMDRAGTGRLPRVWRWTHIAVGSVILFILLLLIQRLVVWPMIMESAISDDLSAVESDTDISAAAPGRAASGDDTGYAVQLGTFSSEILAQHFTQQIEQKGIRAKILYRLTPDQKQHYIVLTGRFATREEAVRAMKDAEVVSTLVSEMSVIPLSEASGDCIHGCDQ